MNSNSKLFLNDNNEKYLPMGIRYNPKSDELVVLGRRDATELSYHSTYYDLAVTGELGFGEIETMPDSLRNCDGIVRLYEKE
ncbi:hypothetical protein Tco_1172020 [Tanacetum coccineum]